MITAAEIAVLETLAAKVAASGLCPPDLKSPAAIFVVMAAGHELGIDPHKALRTLSVVKGKVSLNADTQVALCTRSPACRYFRLAESTDTRAVYITHREGHPEPTTLAYTIEQAQKARLTGSQTWQSHPAAMLRARCAAALARIVYPDLVAGIYSPDEAEEIARSDRREHVDAVVVEPAPPPPPPVPATITAATTCAAAAQAYAAAVNGTDPSDQTLAAWRAECLAEAAHVVLSRGAVVADTGARAVVCDPALAALVDEVLSLAEAGKREVIPGWWVLGQATIAALGGRGPDVLGAIAARAWRGVVELDAATTRGVMTAWRAEVEARTALGRDRQPGDDDGDDTPPTAPQGPARSRRSTATAAGTTVAAPAPEGPAAWLSDDDAAMAHAAGWTHARHVEASVRRHGAGLVGPAADRLVRVATARLEALTADADGTRMTAEGLRRMASRWAAEGPVARKAA
jgi:hypothetical protein